MSDDYLLSHVYISVLTVKLKVRWRWAVVQKLSDSELVFNNDNQHTIEF